MSTGVFSVFLTKTADKGQRKLDKPLREKIRDALIRIGQNPKQSGERLSQPLTMVFSHHVKYQGKEFRIAYQISEETESVVILMIGPHENFYRKLRNVVYAAS